MDLVPITELKIDKTKWLNTKIKYEDKLKLEDLLNDMCENILDWINTIEEYELNTDSESFKKDFKNFIYDKYLYNSKYENIDTGSYDYNYFELKYLEEVNSLFLECEKTSVYYGLKLFQDKDFMELFYFIFENINYFEESDCEYDEEDYLHYNIDA
jgi:hypothetical protein